MIFIIKCEIIIMFLKYFAIACGFIMSTSSLFLLQASDLSLSTLDNYYEESGLISKFTVVDSSNFFDDPAVGFEDSEPVDLKQSRVKKITRDMQKKRSQSVKNTSIMNGRSKKVNEAIEIIDDLEILERYKSGFQRFLKVNRK